MITLANFDLWGRATPKEIKKPKPKVYKLRKAVICVETNQRFENTTEAGNYYNTCAHNIWESCYTNRKIWVNNTFMSFNFIKE